MRRPNRSAVGVRSLLVHQKLLPSSEKSHHLAVNVSNESPERCFGSDWKRSGMNDVRGPGQPVWPREGNQGDTGSPLLIFIGFISESYIHGISGRCVVANLCGSVLSYLVMLHYSKSNYFYTLLT